MVYHVNYRMYICGGEKTIDIVASSKADAYDKATFEEIPKIEETLPYSAWVSSVTYQNGNYKRFNTSEGNPY